MAHPANLSPRRFGRANWRGLWTLCCRDFLRAMKGYRSTIIGPVVSSLLFYAVFQLALGGVATVGPANAAVPFGQFLAAGLAIFATCERAYETATESLVFDKLEGIIADMLMAPLTPTERTVGYAAGAAAAGLVTGAAVLGTLSLIAPPALPAAWLSLGFAVLGALLLALAGVAIGLWAERWDHQSAATSFLLMPILFLSGTFYSIESLPPLGQQLVRLNPIFYLIDGFRAGLTGHSEGMVAWGGAVLLALTVGLGLLVRRLFRIGYKIKP